MKKFLGTLALALFLLNISWMAYGASELEQQFSVLQAYGLTSYDNLPAGAAEQSDLYQAVLRQLLPYSSEPSNIFLDLTDTLKKYSAASGVVWQRRDLHTLAWALKELDRYYGAGQRTVFSATGETGFELEVFHSYTEKPGQALYKDPFNYDLDGDGKLDLYDDDEYMRQYLNVQTGFSTAQMDGALRLKAGLNYFGTGYIGETRQFDLTMPQLNDFTLSIYGRDFTATVGEKQILGFTDYLYYHDPEKPDSYNVSGLTFSAPFGIFFGLGQETILNALNPEKSRDTRWIATGTEGLGFLPMNLYLMEQEFQSPEFRKNGRNVVFALTADVPYRGLVLDGDLAFNDSGDGRYAQLTGKGQFGKLSLYGQAETTEHFTPIQPKGDFTNTTYTRIFYDNSKQVMPARTRTGGELQGQYQLTPGLSFSGKVQNYRNALNEVGEYQYTQDVQAGAQLTLLRGWQWDVTGQYDLAHAGATTITVNSTAKRFGIFSLKKEFGGSNEWGFSAEPIYQGKQVRLQGLLGYATAQSTTEPAKTLQNQRLGLELTYQPVKYFTFAAKYAVEQMAFGVDQPGLNFTRKARLEYQFNDTVSANVSFENVDFRHPIHGYMIEYTNAALRVRF